MYGWIKVPAASHSILSDMSVLSRVHRFWRHAQFVQNGRVERIDVTAQVVSAVVAAYCSRG